MTAKFETDPVNFGSSKVNQSVMSFTCKERAAERMGERLVP